MRPVVKVYLYREEEKVFGEGPYRLLLGIERHASLRAAAGMACATMSASWVVVSMGRSCLCRTMAAAMRRAWRSSP